MGESQYRTISVAVVEDDALAFHADVLALKYAQEHYGLDLAVARVLRDRFSSLSDFLPKINGFRFLQTGGSISATAVLFVGVKPLREFGYLDIRDFGRKVLASLAGEAPQTEHLALTLHGAGYGLDEREAFESEIGGLMDAVISGDFPRSLSRISIVERNPGRAARLQRFLEQLIPDARISADTKQAVEAIGKSVGESLRSAGYSSAGKPLVFVAMPFVDSMEDVFHYGIQNAVNGAGYLCERADQSSFTGDVLDWIKQRIASATLIVADLSTANPNVYLEVGYAWGCGKPTILTTSQAEDLKFDVRGQRCLVYKNIKALEEMLRKELASLARPSRATSAAE
jgi:hypothetical protein